MSALFTDFYELTMAQGYWKQKMDYPAVFEMFFRRQPYNGGFSVFAGLEPLLQKLKDFRFSSADIAYLEKQHIFDSLFLRYLEDFSFKGDLYAMQEGSIIFPNEPLLRVHAGLIEAQIIEGFILNTINFQSLIATKSARMWLASKKGNIMEFGLRRAQGFDGAMSASRAAYIGGVTSTSNTLAAKEFGIPVQGTMAHSWIMSFESELEAFETYAKMYPERSIFLIDTYDTLNSGIKNAVTVGKKLNRQGYNFGVRLDSGDIQYLSQEVRKRLDEAGCNSAQISVSNELTEEIIETLVQQGAPINAWGVGTHMVTGGIDSSFTGVYKLAARSEKSKLVPTMKFSDNPEKTTNPGVKNVFRLYDENGMAKADILALEGENIDTKSAQTFYHPSIDYRQFSFKPSKVENLLKKCIQNGEFIQSEKELTQTPQEKILEAQKNMKSQLELFDSSYKRLLNPHVYKVAISEQLKNLKLEFIDKNLKNTH